MDTSAMREIVQAGVLAPSADNRHSFRAECGRSRIDLFASQGAASGTEGHRRVLDLISLGAVVENMMLRAGELGFEATLAGLPPSEDRLIARIDLERSHSPRSDELARAIPSRHTNRKMYSGPDLSRDETALMDADLTKIDGTHVVWLSGSRRRAALRLIWMAESERFLRKGLHEELFGAIRFDLDWRASADNALPPGALEVEAVMRPLFKALRLWPLMRMLSRVGLHRLLGLRAGYLPCWQAPALGLVTTNLPLGQGAFAVGRGFERIWLRSSLLGLALQPMAAATVLPFQGELDGGASDRVRAKLAAGWRAIVPGMTPLMVFRMGRAMPPSVRSGRMPVSNYIVSAAS